MAYLQSHIVWLDRQPAHANGYPQFMCDKSIKWLEKKVAECLSICEQNCQYPALWQIAKYWGNEPDLPDELRFSLYDAIYGITHRALLAVAEPCWLLKKRD